jgi:UDP-glucose 4-epimerase
MKTKSILVTGHMGFIGGNFVKKFREMFPKILVVGVDIVADDNEEIEENFLSYKASINDKVLMEKIFLKHKPEFVFHFAALPRVAYTVEHPTEYSMDHLFNHLPYS